jgi:FkbM family methyltransferase
VPARLQGLCGAPYEPITIQWLANVLRPGMVVVDVGAHVGYFTMVMARGVGESGRVYSVEPASDNLRFLRSNIERNRAANVIVVPYAAGAEKRARDFHVTRFSEDHGFSEHPIAETVCSRPG